MPAGGLNGGARPAGGERQAGGQRAGADVEVDPRITALCDIPTPHFAFDAANLSRDARAALDALVTCFTSGKRKGHGLKFVGHADPRGLPDYNFALGQRRAGSLAAYVIGQGIGEERVESSSRGELDARGNDEPRWQRDRRVEILLADD